MEIVPKAEQHREIASDLYHGGAVYPRHGALHPGKYHLELLRIARAAGVQVVDQCKAQAIERDGAKFRVRTAKGTVTARDVVLATNGYSGPLSPWHRRRVIPIGSYIIATEPRPAEEMRKLIPHDRMVSDTRRVVFTTGCRRITARSCSAAASPIWRATRWSARRSCTSASPRSSPA
jgi:glycine/D-amino acid oxidase-like deaminating enzyme